MLRAFVLVSSAGGIDALSLACVLLFAAAVFLLALACVGLLRPQHARRFLLGFARSWRRHAVELGVRLLLGAALWRVAPQIRYPAVFQWAAWILIGTTLVMLVLPWRMHQRFAARMVPRALVFLPLIAVTALFAGLALLALLLEAGPSS